MDFKTQLVRVVGSRPQGPVGQVSKGLGARAPRAWGPAHQKPLKLRFFRKPPGGSLAKAWVSAETAASEVGTWRETKPGYPPPTPPCSPKTLGGGGGGGGGYPGFVSLQVPTSEAAVSADTHAFARLPPPGGLRKIVT